jgi:cytoskeletal protein CcmA (bactofilin family)
LSERAARLARLPEKWCRFSTLARCVAGAARAPRADPALTTLKHVFPASRRRQALDWPLDDRTQEHVMFNKPNLFPKAGENGPNRPGAPRGPSAGAREPALPRATGATPSAAGMTPSAPVTPDAAARDRDEAGKGDSRLIVGPEVKLRGAEILDCDTLVVEGRVDATMDSRVLRIAQSGAFEGKVGVDVAEIHGRFDGELTAREQLVIHAGGRVSGKIRYGSIFIEEGGRISGDIMANDADERPRARDAAPRAEQAEDGKAKGKTEDAALTV